MGRHSRKATPLPALPVLALAGILLTEAVNLYIAFPLAHPMCQRFQVPKESRASYEGWLVASWSLAQLAASFAWGQFSDLIGRKPALLYGTSGSALFTFLYGCASTYEVAIVFRTLSGLCHGVSSVSRATMTEMTDDTNRAKGFSIITLVYGLGKVLGPLLGYYLMFPRERFPKAFSEASVFTSLPFLLPCLVSGIIALLAILLCSCFMVETLLEDDTTIIAEFSGIQGVVVLDEAQQKNLAVPDANVPLSRLLDATALRVMGIDSILCLIIVMVDTVYLSWARDGLGIGSESLSELLAASFLLVTVVQLGLVPFLRRRVRLTYLAPIGFSVLTAFYAAMPLLWIVYKHSQSWGLVVAVHATKTSVANYTTIATAMMVNHLVPPRYLGRINGLTDTLMSAMRAAGPVLADVLAGEAEQAPWPVRRWHLVFLSCAFAGFLATLMSIRLPKRLNEPAPDLDVVMALPLPEEEAVHLMKQATDPEGAPMAFLSAVDRSGTWTQPSVVVRQRSAPVYLSGAQAGQDDDEHSTLLGPGRRSRGISPRDHDDDYDDLDHDGGSGEEEEESLSVRTSRPLMIHSTADAYSVPTRTRVLISGSVEALYSHPPSPLIGDDASALPDLYASLAESLSTADMAPLTMRDTDEFLSMSRRFGTGERHSGHTTPQHQSLRRPLRQQHQWLSRPPPHPEVARDEDEPKRKAAVRDLDDVFAGFAFQPPPGASSTEPSP